jgi:hypothetical protein
MLTFLKLFAIAVLFIQIIIIRINILSGLIIATELIVLMNAPSIKIKQLFKKNIFIISFPIFFGLFAFISGIMAHNLNNKKIFEIILKIIFTFNCIYPGLCWIGQKGLMLIINAVPSERLNLFFIFFIKTIEYLTRTHSRILNQLSVRLNLNYSGKFLIAKYYVRNMIFKELYAFSHNQAAFYTRISEVPQFYAARENAGLADIIALFAIFAGAVTSVILQ